MRVHRRWPIDWNERADKRAVNGSALIVPEFPVPRGMPVEAAALLPNFPYNRNLLESLAFRPDRISTTEVATVFAADPFLNVNQFAKTISRGGISRIANLPSISQFGPQFGLVANELEIGLDAEWTRLAEFSSMGFEVFSSITHEDQVEPAIRSGARALIAILPLECDQGEPRTDQLNALCQRIRAVNLGRVPVLALAGERWPGLNSEWIAGTIRYGA